MLTDYIIRNMAFKPSSHGILKHVYRQSLSILASRITNQESRSLSKCMNAKHGQVASSLIDTSLLPILQTQSLLPSIKIQLKRCVTNEKMLGYLDYPRKYSICTWNLNRVLKNVMKGWVTASSSDCCPGDGVLGICTIRCSRHPVHVSKLHLVRHIPALVSSLGSWSFDAGPPLRLYT